MPPLATVISAWAAVYAYVCAYYCILYARRRSERVQLAFGMMSGALCIYASGSVMLADADTLVEGALAANVRGIGLAPGVAFVVDFCHQLSGRGRSRAMMVAYGWAGVSLVLTVAGLQVDVTQGTPPPTWGFAAAPDYVEPVTTWIGKVNLIIAWLFVAYGISLLVPEAKRNTEARLLLGTMVINALAAFHDLLVHSASLRSPYMLEHAAMLSIVAMSYLLLDRFVRTGEDLASRTLQLRSSYDELRMTQEELVHKEQLAAVGELSAVIAHEVRNPLAVIKSSVAGLRRAKPQEEDESTLLSILDEEVDRLNRLVNDLLAYARPVAPQGRQVPLEDLVHRSVDLARRGGERHSQIDVSVELSHDPQWVHGDPDLLRHAFVNIVENALQAMGGGGTLTIRARELQHDGRPWVSVDFDDTGEGMDTLVRSKARDPFFTTRPTGTGLGLAIVERVLRTHGGRLEIASRSGQGTTVSVVLPASPEGAGALALVRPARTRV